MVYMSNQIFLEQNYIVLIIIQKPSNQIKYLYTKFTTSHIFRESLQNQVNQPIYNKHMLLPKELEKLFQILNTKEKSLEEIQEKFLMIYNENLSVFQASYVLNHLINNNLLTLQQRIITIFLLIQNFKSQGIKKNPFGGTILSISQKTNEGFQRKMISDLVLEVKRQKYARLKIEQLFDDEQYMIELAPQKPEIKKMRQEFLAQLPKISQTRNSQMPTVVTATNERNRFIYPPEQFYPNCLEKKQFIKPFEIGTVRPIPKFIQINPFEMNWLSAGIVADVHWDNSIDIQKKFVKFKGYIKKGLQSKLSKEQSAEIDRCLQNQAYAVLNLDLTPQNLLLLINNNPYVAVSFLLKLGNYSIIGQYLDRLLDCNISLNCIDVVVRLIKYSRIPVQFIETFLLKNLKQSQSLSFNNKDYGKMGRIISKFISTIKRNKVMDINQFTEEITEFTNHFKDLEQVQNLEKQLYNYKNDTQLK